MEKKKELGKPDKLELPSYAEVKGPVLMVNMLRFKNRAHYFDTYLPAFRRVTEQLGFKEVKVQMALHIKANILTSADEQWDCILVVEYPSAQAFKTIAESQEYQDIANPHRMEATAALNLYMTTLID